MSKTFRTFCAMAIAMLIFASCQYDTPKQQGNNEASDDIEATEDQLVGKWERQSAEGLYTLYIESEGTGKLISYEHASAVTEKFKYNVTDKGVVVDWGKFRKETYHAVLTVDGKYLVLDNRTNVYVYKKRTK